MATKSDATAPMTGPAAGALTDPARATNSQLSELLYELADLLSTDGKPKSAGLAREAARRLIKATGAA